MRREFIGSLVQVLLTLRVVSSTVQPYPEARSANPVFDSLSGPFDLVLPSADSKTLSTTNLTIDSTAEKIDMGGEIILQAGANPNDPDDNINVGGAIRAQNVNLISKKKVYSLTYLNLNAVLSSIIFSLKTLLASTSPTSSSKELNLIEELHKVSSFHFDGVFLLC